MKNVGKETSGITHPVVVSASDKVIHQPDSAVLPFVCSSLLELTELIGLTIHVSLTMISRSPSEPIIL